MQMRVLCKRALRQMLDKLGAALQAGRASPPAAAEQAEPKMEL